MIQAQYIVLIGLWGVIVGGINGVFLGLLLYCMKYYK